MIGFVQDGPGPGILLQLGKGARWCCVAVFARKVLPLQRIAMAHGRRSVAKP